MDMRGKGRKWIDMILAVHGMLEKISISRYSSVKIFNVNFWIIRIIGWWE